MTEHFSGDFENIKDPGIDDHIMMYMGLDKAKVEKEYGTAFNFVNSFLHSKVFNIDIDLYGEKAIPFHNVIRGVNSLIDAGLDVNVLTARNENELDMFVEDREKEGIVAKTHRFVERYLPKINGIIIVGRMHLKEQYIDRADVWVDDDYGKLLEKLESSDIYIVKNQFPRNEHLFAHSIISDRSIKEQPFAKDVIGYAERTGRSRVITDLDDTLAIFKGNYKEVCDYAMKHYPEKFRDLRREVV